MGKRGEMSTGWDLSTKMMGAIRDAIGDIPAKCFFDIETASFEKDTTQATDLVLKLSGGYKPMRQIEKAGCIIWQYANSSQYEYGGF
jgi:hypothetical protein